MLTIQEKKIKIKLLFAFDFMPKV